MWFFHSWLIYLKALVSRFSKTFDCLWHFLQLRSNSNSFLSFLIEKRINFFALRNFSDFLHFYFLNMVIRFDLFIMSLLTVLFINGALLPAMNFFLQGNNLSRVFQKISKTFPTLLLIRTCDNTSKKVSLKILLKNIYSGTYNFRLQLREKGFHYIDSPVSIMLDLSKCFRRFVRIKSIQNGFEEFLQQARLLYWSSQ